MTRLVCQLGCSQCSDGTGDCTSCKSGFTQDGNDHTKCITVSPSGSTIQQCPDAFFLAGNNCTVCSPACQSCTGPTSNDCFACSAGHFTLNGQCVGADGNGVCLGSTMVADNIKLECEGTRFNESRTVDVFLMLYQLALQNALRAIFPILTMDRSFLRSSALVASRVLYFPKASVLPSVPTGHS